MKSMKFDYEKALADAYRENRDAVVGAVAAGKLDTKINNFCRTHGFGRGYVIEQIKNNDVVAAFFAVNPNKQNMYEKTAAEFIRGMGGVTDFNSLHNSKLSISGGSVISRKELKKRGGTSSTKTVDFQWQHGGNLYYAAHKYTKDSGGAQDNQYRDLHAFIQEANQNSSQNVYFAVIADGAYYDTKNDMAGMTRIESLKWRCSGNVFACRISELEAEMAERAK